MILQKHLMTFETTGRQEYFNYFIGMDPITTQCANGYDSDFDFESDEFAGNRCKPCAYGDGDPCVCLTPEERKELGEFMIAAWKKWMEIKRLGV